MPHRVEALPRSGSYAVTFRRDDGGEQVAIIDLDGDDVRVAAASLPAGWTIDGAPFRATADAVRALHDARSAAPSAASLVDVDGGWDVGLGNVVLGADGVPACTAHGPMQEQGAVFECPDCGARAQVIGAA